MGQRRAPVVVFVDIDGVLSIADSLQADLRREQWPGCGPAWPIPLANALVRALDRDRRVQPVWMTYWGRRARLWNDRAGTSPWPVAYPLVGKRLRAATQLALPVADDAEAPSVRDGKLLAACYHLRRWPERSVVWIEDGFSPDTLAWAHRASPRVRLLDATAPAVYAFLVAEHADLEAAARAFLEECLG